MPEATARVSGLKADPRMRDYFADESERLSMTREMFDQAATGYDRAERLMAFGSGACYRREVLRRNGLAPGMCVLDIAAGTGLVTTAAAALVGPTSQVLALDPSPGMLAELQRKLDVQTILAYAEAIPLPDAHADFLSMGYALRHVGDAPPTRQ
jgi:demethylmenaquinone methyltransferase / 2-methoxy-6-polyprenyl-1,4-benzoquinol methylase